MAAIDLGPVEQVASGFAFTEDPRWRDGRLYFSDMQNHRVHAVTEDGQVSEVAVLSDAPSGLGFMPNGDLLIVAMTEQNIYRLGPGGLTVHADVSAFAGRGINDMAVDAAGRAYVVQFGFDYSKNEPFKTSPLIVVEPDGTPGIAAPDLAVGNGIVISGDGRTLFVAESAAGRITCFDIDPAGRLSNRRVFAELPQGHHPDGICIDSAGGVWAAALNNGVIRMEEGGRVTHQVKLLPGRNAYACMLGGKDRGDLYICTAETHEHGPATAKMNAAIDRVRNVGFTGEGLP
jgi:sugar lactone lactonase YvrE